MGEALHDPPRATVIVTCYNQLHWIEQALDSVAAQTERRVRLVVTDDGSTDGSAGVIGGWLESNCPSGTLVASPTNRGLPAMVNMTRPFLQGDYVVVVNGDDWMEPQRIEQQADFFDQLSEEVGVVYSRLRVVDEEGDPTGIVFPKEENIREGRILSDLISNIDLGMPGLMIRRSVLEAVGQWDESLVADDLDLVLRIATDYEFRYLPIVAVNYRINEGSLTRSRKGALVDSRFRAVQKHVGTTPEVTTAALVRLDGLAVALHGAGHDRKVTRSYVWFVLRQRPTKRLMRVLVEQLLHLRPGRLVLRRKR